jgi:hypothetical protein
MNMLRKTTIGLITLAANPKPEVGVMKPAQDRV